jgi:hypothetical protein
MNSSKRSVMPGSLSLSRASGADLDRVVGDEGRLDQLASTVFSKISSSSLPQP